MSDFIVIQGDCYRKSLIAGVQLIPGNTFKGGLSTPDWVKVLLLDSRFIGFDYPSFEEALADRDRIVKELTGETND